MNSTQEMQTAGYSALLARMISLTDRVSTAALNMNTDDMNRLLAEREALCNMIVSARHTLPALDEVSARMESVLLDKQANCESIVAASLAETRRTIGDFHQKKELGAAYAPQNESNQARYLDNRT